MIIELETPVLVARMFKYETIKQVELRIPKVKDLAGLDLADSAKNQEHFVILISRISGLKKSIIEDIALGDWLRIQTTFNKMVGIK